MSAQEELDKYGYVLIASRDRHEQGTRVPIAMSVLEPQPIGEAVVIRAASREEFLERKPNEYIDPYYRYFHAVVAE